MAHHPSERPGSAEALPSGVLISFEGGDGAGKSTHIRFLERMLEQAGREVVRVREPGGTSIGEQLRAIVLDPANGEMTRETELLIYEAARAQITSEVIRPALERGAVVLTDRFIDSSLAYQGAGRGLSEEFIRTANTFATGDLVPDRTILLRCANKQEKKGRVSAREATDRLERAGDGFHARVNAAFDELPRTDPERIRVVETSGRHSDTARAIFAEVSDLFPWLSEDDPDVHAALQELDASHRSTHIPADGLHGQRDADGEQFDLAQACDSAGGA